MRKRAVRWYAEPLIINFNHKEWRQDLADFVRRKQYWGFALVTKPKVVDKGKNNCSKGTKWFEIYDGSGSGRYVKIVFKNKNQIVSIESDGFDEKIIENYFKLRILN